ncbi:MAG: endonuclease/exonuclease/phosphatase family protein [Sandaracinus sp.]|nr:endonuclease/exonuclease/phosphatase family protein [Sandaracinus sp.]MCB9622797.1 endonuclease/exonuclease/phosphatase family protein [Sandaracinus sp.]
MRTARERRMAFTLAVLGVIGWPLLRQWWSPRAYGDDSVAPTSNRLRVATYNVNFGLAGEATTTDAITALEVDVLLLQETNAAWERALAEPLRARFPHQVWVDAESYPAGGIALLSRHPLTDVARNESAIDWFPALAATVATPLGDVRVIDVHLKPPVSSRGSVFVGRFSTPSERAREMRSHLDALLRPGLPTLIAGDLNEERGGSLDVLANAGFRDAVAMHLGHAPTWRWPVGPLTLRQQLDHLLVDDRFVVEAVAIVDAGASDHLPVVATLRRHDPTASMPDDVR